MGWKKRLASASLFVCLTSQAAEPQELTISVGDWPPYLSPELKHNGVVAHLISDILADEGYRVRFQFLPWPRACAAAAAGQFDASAVWMRKDEREADFLYSEPVLEEQFVLFHLKSLPFDWNRFDDLTGMTLGGGWSTATGRTSTHFWPATRRRWNGSPRTCRTLKNCSRNAWCPIPRSSMSAITR